MIQWPSKILFLLHDRYNITVTERERERMFILMLYIIVSGFSFGCPGFKNLQNELKEYLTQRAYFDIWIVSVDFDYQ